MKLDPKKYGLPARTHLEKLDEHTIGLIVRRKSRIIMADGRKLVEKAMCIQETATSTKVALVTTAPICGKTRTFLEASGITILEE
ncbi:MAG: hypothetical protein ACI8ZB_000495 [Desulforhopalus sp.]|jgi:hypothetical protein